MIRSTRLAVGPLEARRPSRTAFGQGTARAARAARQATRWLVSRAAYGLAMLPAVTDWIDTGHWPAHPREFVTEVLVGIVIFLGVRHLHRRAERYRTLSQTDPLTGLGNRARFRADLDAAVARARREGSGLAVAIVDVDRFKRVNDTFGHGAGDDVLREVGVALARSVRQDVDGFYRLGGDEFAVLLADVEPAQALQALRRGFDRAEAVVQAPLSCSVGIVTLGDDEDTHAFVQRADHLMYEAKHGDVREGETQAFGRVTLGGSAAATSHPSARASAVTSDG